MKVLGTGQHLAKAHLAGDFEMALSVTLIAGRSDVAVGWYYNVSGKYKTLATFKNKVMPTHVKSGAKISFLLTYYFGPRGVNWS